MALRLVLLAETVRRQLVQAGAQYRTFFAWLLIVLRRMQEDAPDVLVGYPRSQLEAVEVFLAGHYRQDEVGPLLGIDSSGGTHRSNGGSSTLGASRPAAAAEAAASGGMLELVMEVLGRQAVVQAADSSTGATPGGSGSGGEMASSGSSSNNGQNSLGCLLDSLNAACLVAFGGTSEVVSPTLGLSSSVSLGPVPSALTASYLPGSATAATAVAWEGHPQVLVLRGADGGETPGLEAAVVQLPGSTVVADLAFYKDGQLALLLAPTSAGGGGGGQGGCRLLLLSQDRLQYVQLPGELLADCDAQQLCQMMLEGAGLAAAGRSLLDDCRQRRLPYPRVQRPLAVSASRGVGCVLAGTQRVLLYDLEEEEEEEDDGEGASPGDALDGGDSGAGFDSPR